MYELKKQGLKAQNQVPLPVYYDDVKLEDIGFRLDIIVENKVVIELKSVDVLVAVHHKQLLTYLKLSKLKLGILVNFNCSDITKQIFRKVNDLQIVS